MMEINTPADMDKKYHKLILVTAPSGSGKTSIVKFLIRKFPVLAFSVSATTRKPRSNEKDGVDYYFISQESFEKKIHEKEFLEWEMVYEGKYYGTLKSEIERLWSEGRVPILDIDVQGAIHVQQHYPVNTMVVFVQAPSAEELRRRLESRGSETLESLEARVSKSAYEMTFKKHFDKVVINRDFDTACQEAAGLVEDFLAKP